MISLRRTLRCLALLAALASCSSTTYVEYVYVPVAVGATPTEVRSAVGEPLRIAREGSEETWWYPQDAHVVITDGKVLRTSAPTIPSTLRRPSPPLPGSSSSVKDVSVRGYYRKDGTYVRPHYRSRPRR